MFFFSFGLVLSYRNVMLLLCPDIRVLQADMLDLPFADDCFDVVIEKGTMVSE